MAGTIIVTSISVLIFLFSLWRRLKEDYIAHQIFTTASYILVISSVSMSLVSKFFPDYWFWVGVLGVSVGTMVGVGQFRLRLAEVAEAVIISLLPVLALFFAYMGFAENNIIAYELGGGMLGLLMLFLILDAHYKKFTWYKSGRVGFSGITVWGLFFLIRALVAINFPDVLSFVPEYEIYLSGIAAFLSFLSLFFLAKY